MKYVVAEDGMTLLSFSSILMKPDSPERFTLSFYSRPSSLMVMHVAYSGLVCMYGKIGRISHYAYKPLLGTV